MYLDANDAQEYPLFRTQTVTLQMIMGGIFCALGAHIAVPLIALFILSFFTLVGIGGKETAPPIQELHVVEARFVKLGEIRDPRKLPNRRVPIKSTAPDRSVVVSKNMNPDRPEKQPDEKRPHNAQEDPLTRLGDRAQAFAEIADKREQEGDPQGVEWGTSTESREGDIYLGQLVAFFKRGFTVPVTLSRDELRPLVCKVTVQITHDLLVGAFQITRGSGNPVFDQEVTNLLERLRQLQAKVPEPPPEVSHLYLGKKIAINFRGSDAR